MVALPACGGDGSGDEQTPVSNDPVVTQSPVTGAPTTSEPQVAEDLAPSQIAASTVPRPATPPPCESDELVFWTAQAVVVDATAGAVVRIRNDGDLWCEVDISSSGQIDPTIEPDVWLEPGEWADLVASHADPICETPEVVSFVPLDANGEQVEVPAALVTCGLMLVAFYPAELAAEPCPEGSLQATVVDGAVLVRNSSTMSCQLGELTAVVVDGPVGRLAAEASADIPTVADLAPGDVVAFPVQPMTGDGCQAESVQAMVEFSLAAAVALEMPTCVDVLHGAARPWFGDGSGRPVAGGAATAAEVLAALDPFADS